MPPTDDLHDEQTVTFRAPADWVQPAEPSSPVHQLLLLVEAGPARRLPLHDFPVTIGRAPPAELVLEGGTISRRHCRLEEQGGRLLLTDLGSTNGTFVDGTRVDTPVTLEDGATITVGAHRLRYQCRGSDETAEAEAMDRDLQEAADYVASILPPAITGGPVQTEWFHRPCSRLGGDAFGYQMVDQRCFAVFLLDVAGHGTGAALHSASVVNVLRRRLLPDVDFRDPAAVIRSLNRMFPMEQHNALFFTIWYGVYDIPDRMLTFATGGHHAGFLLPLPNEGPPPWQPVALATSNPAIGIVPDGDMGAARVSVPPDSALYLFSDGAFEIVARDGREWGLQDILPLLPAAIGSDGPRSLYEQVRSLARPGPLDDDFSALLVRFP
ncbi:MAG TPA: SpoIIE family protein phosphatase [Acetobacteraceae bacterium]|jgi:serine phosphatase RsbU (regulator of sigma subunit)